MKMKLNSIAFLASVFCIQAATAEDQPTYIYLIDPADKATMKDFEEDLKPEVTTTNSAPTESKPVKPKRTIDDIVNDLSKKPPMTKSQERILARVTADQMRFIHLMDEFTKLPFDPNDDLAHPEFNKARERIVKLVFDSPTEKFFYERLFLVNKSWLEHSTEVARYQSLDKALRDKALELEERSRRFRQVIMGVAAVGGAVGGGFLSYKYAQKILPIVADDKGFAQIIRWAGRGTIVFIGAGVGGVVGAQLGFLGSEFLFKRRDYVNPIDGDEDLRDLLDMIEDMQ